MIKVSVIMGVYNTNNEEMLRKSIHSILAQTFTDFEFIICDDGSTDGTYEILQKICKSDRRAKLIRNEVNMGLAATLNRCIAVSQGEYIARQDADDYSVPQRIQKQVDFLDQNSRFAFVGSNIARFDDNGQWGEYKLKPFVEKHDFLFTVPIIHGTVVFRKNALLAVNGYRIAKETRRTEDYDLFMRMYAKSFKAANIQENLYFVREDKIAYKRRKYIYRIDEAIVKYKGFRLLGLMPKGFIYVLKPLIVGLISPYQLNAIKKIFYENRKVE